MNAMKSIKQHQAGVALVEFALILPLLLILSFATVEFGRALYQFNTVAKSVRDAVRYLSVQPAGTHLTEAANLVVYGNTAGTGTPVAPGLTTSHVQPPSWQTVGTAPAMSVVTVSVSGYGFQSMFTSVFGLSFGPFTYSDIRATMRSHL
ncbi:pilus assembly protein [Ramlibacter sp. AW1]|uniref:Pilus assembly protein n=1 Tax=Ramlibacter aurantiacus TaxID=2801330 RepID=A0A936ZLT5_9BURK|nr:TadE family protein [Ramlibacter aurantiacus]MBL0419590.1 pilus assembly protein [Ramlibacter aurantiacus]